MAEIINQIPGFENGIVHYVSAADEVDALFLSAQIISDLLNKWNTSVAFFSLSSRSEGLKRLVENNSTVARLYTVNQKNHSLQVILRKAKVLNEDYLEQVCKWFEGANLKVDIGRIIYNARLDPRDIDSHRLSKLTMDLRRNCHRICNNK